MRGFCLEISGKNACFTRPEMKAERVSYDVITPSAGRAIFEAILWKPAIIWEVKRIEILSPIRWETVRRNEVGDVASSSSTGIYIEESRQQRASLLLRDVCYRIWAEFTFLKGKRQSDPSRPLLDLSEEVDASLSPLQNSDQRSDETEAKYAAMFERRAEKGQTFHQPYLGCREFPASFRLIRNPDSEPSKKVPELAGERDFGWSLFDMNYSDPDNVSPMFYRPVAIDGVIDVEKYRKEAGIPDAAIYQVARKDRK